MDKETQGVCINFAKIGGKCNCFPKQRGNVYILQKWGDVTNLE